MTRFTKLAALSVFALCAAVAVSIGARSASSQTATKGGVAATALSSATGCKASRGKITYGIAGAGITALDPNTLSFAGQSPLQTLLYDGLTQYDKKMQPVADLATSWKASKDLMHWTFKLRRDVRYASGRPFTSSDAQANILRVLDPNVPSQARGNVADIRSVRTNGKWGLVIKLGHPSALLTTALVDVKMSDTTDVANLNKTGNGTGPYKVSDFVPGQNLTLVPNTHYWGGKPCLQEIDFLREPDPTSMVTDFKSGKLDMIWQVPPVNIPAVTMSDSSFLVPSGVSGAHVWEVDTTSGPFSDVRARQALSYAIDRKTMVQTAFFGLGTPSYANDILSANNSFYDKTLKPYTFNLAKAKLLFDAAGV
jgi:peptide/nickel transport system substrate-binding protein